MRAFSNITTVTRRVLVVFVLLMVLAGGLAYLTRNQAEAKQGGDCGDWVSATSERVGIARDLLAPAERQEQSTGSVQGDAQALYDLAQEQANSNPPDIAYYLHGAQDRRGDGDREPGPERWLGRLGGSPNRLRQVHHLQRRSARERRR